MTLLYSYSLLTGPVPVRREQSFPTGEPRQDPGTRAWHTEESPIREQEHYRPVQKGQTNSLSG